MTRKLIPEASPEHLEALRKRLENNKRLTEFAPDPEEGFQFCKEPWEVAFVLLIGLYMVAALIAAVWSLYGSFPSIVKGWLDNVL